MPDQMSGHLAPRYFETTGSDMLVGGVPVRNIASQVGTPLYIYEAAAMRNAHRRLADALGSFAEIHYSVKANPCLAVIKLFAAQGCGMEIASLGEYRAARRAGVAADRILFAGPGKRVQELEEVIAEGIGEIHIESIEESRRIADISRRLRLRVKAAIRINPVPEIQAGAMRMGGKPTAFGFAEEDAAPAIQEIIGAGGIDLIGVHIYGGTQILDADALVAQWTHAIDIASTVAAQLGRPLETIDLGGGFGIPYYAGETELDLAKIAAAVPALSERLKGNPLAEQARVIVEPGRYLAGPGGIYVMEINAVKRSRGTRFLITDGGMHHHLAASGNLGQVIKRDYPIVAPARMDATELSTAHVVGPLCTPLDTLGRDASLPDDLKAGDLIAVLQSGAYGLTASPVGFLSHPAPAEVMVDSGVVRLL